MVRLCLASLRRFVSRHHDERGQILFTFAPLLIGFFILGALAWDAGVWYFDHRTAQNQVDAAALAAVQELPATMSEINSADGALDKAEEWLDHNGVGGGSTFSDFVPGVPACDGIPSGGVWVVFGNKADDDYYTVRVCVRRDSLVLFSGLAGITEAIVSAGGTAEVELVPVPYALMALDPSDCSTLNVHGTGTTVELLDDGKSYTASAGPCGGNNRSLRVDGIGAEFSAAGHDVCAPPPGGNGQLNGTVSQLCGLPDPWANVDPPVSAATCEDPDISGGTLGPGTYCDLTVPSGTALELTGGEYIFWDDFRATAGGSSVFTSGETIIYMTCGPTPCDGDRAGSFVINVEGDPALELEGHTDYEHIAIYVDRTSRDFDCVSVAGSGTLFIDGNIYSVSCQLSMSGGGAAEFDLNGTIVSNTIDFGGGAQYNVTWNAEFAPKFPSYALVD